jgi:hypothetical protein
MLDLRETWLEIARQIANGEARWVCNAAYKLRRDGRISKKTLATVLARVERERERQGVQIPREGSPSLWPNLGVFEPSGARARVLFCASELRRLAS